MNILKLSFPLAVFFLLASCNSNKPGKEELYTSADSVSVSGLQNESVKLIKTAEMNFRVKDVYKGSRDISSKARALGGIVVHHAIESVRGREKSMRISPDSLLVVTAYSMQADLTVKVPSARLEEFMNEISSYATFINSSKLDIDDKSLDYLASSMKQASRQALLHDAKNKTVKSADVTDLISMEDELTDQKINNLRTDADVKYSTVLLSLSQNAGIRKEVIANNDLSAYDLPFSSRLSNALVNGWQLFISFIIGVAHLWLFILLGAAIWIAIRFFKRRKPFQATT